MPPRPPRSADLARVLLVLAVAVPLVGAVRGIAVVGIVASTILLELGIAWSRAFARRHSRSAERAWTWWMLLPSLGAIGMTLSLRDEFPPAGVAALAGISIFVIFFHALVMGQRSRATEDTPAAAPQGPVAVAVAWAPTVASTLVFAVLGIVQVVELVA